MNRSRLAGPTSANLRLHRWAGLVLAGLLLGPAVAGREFEVRLLSGTEADGVWGTSEFSVSVSSAGLMRCLNVHGRELVWQVAALYTSPVPPDAAAGVRTVQGEGYGDRGLTLVPPRTTAWTDGGKQGFEFEHLVANRKVLDGAPLCRVLQQVLLAPTGEIRVSYDCEWLQTVRWDDFQVLLFLKAEPYRGQDFYAFSRGQFTTGAIEPGLAAERQLRSEPITRLTLRSEPGLVHFVWDATTRGSFYWGGDQLQLSMVPPSVPYRSFLYKGQKDRVTYRVLLPVSQQ